MNLQPGCLLFVNSTNPMHSIGVSLMMAHWSFSQTNELLYSCGIGLQLQSKASFPSFLNRSDSSQVSREALIALMKSLYYFPYSYRKL
ncbi:hypothetical protein FGO68_gene5907 [Halteria grandinella]|uniref:Uncharacterized protein n=1 Tax=Halteria grandinella TaxID=5974 RepID=A0A8J8NLV0_HALGN|nr:hypothetical protein FGO68_gene5907 [Halteria grandinella]